MRRATSACCVVWVTTALACASGPGATAAAGPEPKLPPGSDLERDLANGTVRFLKGQNLSRDLDADPTFKASRIAGDAEGAARAFLAHFRALWRLDDPNAELAKQRVLVDRTGASHVRFEQVYRGLRIPGAELIVHLDRERRVVLVNGTYVPTPRGVAVSPELDEGAARAAAAKAAGTEPCGDCATELVVFAERHAGPRLAWRVAPPKGRLRGEEITVDAENGDVLRRLPAALPAGRRGGGEGG